MKLNIRGLVFTGFAAAVFASSAQAVTPPTEQYGASPEAGSTAEVAVDNLKKTVTSKYYTDENFQERLQGTTADMSLTEDPQKGVTEEAAFVGWNYGQGGIEKEWVKLEGNPQVGTGNEQQAYVQIKHSTTDANNKTHYVQMNTNTIANTAQKIKDAGETSGANDAITDLEEKRLTTAKAVYDFVTDELDEMGADIRGNETYHTQKVAVMKDSWVQTHPSDAPYVVNPTNDQLDNIDHWELIVPNARVAGTAQNIIDGGTLSQTNLETNLTTAKAVYDFVTDSNDGFQRKITTSEANALRDFNYDSTTETYADAGRAVMIGYRDTSGANTESTWYIFGAKPNGNGQSNDNHLSYLKIDRETDSGTGKPKFLVDIKPGAVAGSSTDIFDAGASGAALVVTDKLTTAKAVYQLLDVETTAGTTTITSASTNTVVPTSKNVFDFVQTMMGGQALPTMPGKCIVNGVHCALVTNYHAADATHNEPYATLEWTVMAGSESSGSGGTSSGTGGGTGE